MDNCRESYHSIARAFGVTCPTIIQRVNRLRHLGVIQRFVAEVSQETLGVEWVMAEVQFSQAMSKSRLLELFASNGCIGEVLMLGKGRYLILAELYPEERAEFISCIKSIEEVEYIEISDIHQVSNSMGNGRCKFTTRGEYIQLSRRQIDVLQYLVGNARVPTKTIADELGCSQKAVRKLIRRFIECNGIHLTLSLNLNQCGQINFILRSRLRDLRADPREVSEWLKARYPQAHWFTFFAPRSDSLIHYMTVTNPKEIHDMLHEVIKHPYIDDVEANIIYSIYKSESRTQQYLQRCARVLDEEEYDLSVPSTQEAKITY